MLFAGHLLGPKDLQTFPSLQPPLGRRCMSPPAVENWGPENNDPLWRDTHYPRQVAASLV